MIRFVCFGTAPTALVPASALKKPERERISDDCAHVAVHENVPRPNSRITADPNPRPVTQARCMLWEVAPARRRCRVSLGNYLLFIYLLLVVAVPG